MTNSVNFTVEEFYQKIKTELNLVKGYLEDNEIIDIIIQCRLKPYNHNFSGRKKISKFKTHWIDEFGNSLYLIKKRIKIIENDLNIDKNKIKYSDLYYGLDIGNIIKISKIMYLIDGIDEDDDRIYIITLLGIDNYLRTFVCQNNQWIRLSPLCLGIDNLRKIIKNEDIKSWKRIKSREDIIIPCKCKDEWIICLPVNNKFWEDSKINKNKLSFLER